MTYSESPKNGTISVSLNELQLQKKKAAMTPRLTNDNPDEEGEEDGYNKDEGRLK